MAPKVPVTREKRKKVSTWTAESDDAHACVTHKKRPTIVSKETHSKEREKVSTWTAESHYTGYFFKKSICAKPFFL